MRRPTLLAAALLALGATPASAATFGPDLGAATANYPYACAYGATNQGCTVVDPKADDMELVLPDPVKNGDQTGVVTAMHVKSAATVPAQFVVLEWAGKPGEGQPFLSGVKALSERVTLRPGVNDFNTNLPVDFRLTDDGYEVWSQIALNVLSPSAPIPAQAGVGTMSGLGYVLDGGLPLTQTVADLTVVPHNPQIGGLGESTLLMAGDVKITTGDDVAPTPNPGPDPQPGPNPPVTPVAPQVKVPGSARVKGRAATLAVTCAGATACKGTVRIQSRAAKGKGRAVTYATRAFSLAAGASKPVKLTLSKAARRHRTLHAYANTTFADGTVTSTRITLKR
jgi:hypothetical protein